MSNRPMHASKRLIGLVSIAFAAVVFSAAPAGAVIAFPEPEDGAPGLHVSVGNKWEYQVSTICGETFSYVQRMTIDGVSTMVPTEFLYAPGRHQLILLQKCDGYFTYALARGTGGV